MGLNLSLFTLSSLLGEHFEGFFSTCARCTCQTHILHLLKQPFSIRPRCNRHNKKSARIFGEPGIYSKWMAYLFNPKLQLFPLVYLVVGNKNFLRGLWSYISINLASSKYLVIFLMCLYMAKYLVPELGSLVYL